MIANIRISECIDNNCFFSELLVHNFELIKIDICL